jgi:hypothetical protein
MSRLPPRFCSISVAAIMHLTALVVLLAPVCSLAQSYSPQPVSFVVRAAHPESSAISIACYRSAMSACSDKCTREMMTSDDLEKNQYPDC